MTVGGVGIGQPSSIQTTNLADARTGSSDAAITKALRRILRRPADLLPTPADLLPTGLRRPADLLPTGSNNDVDIGRPIRKEELNRKLSIDDGVRDQLLQRVKDRAKGSNWSSLREDVRRDCFSADDLQKRLMASLNAQKAKPAPLPPLDLRAAAQQWIGALPLVGPQLRSLAADYLANQDPEAVLAKVRGEVDQFLQNKF